MHVTCVYNMCVCVCIQDIYIEGDDQQQLTQDSFDSGEGMVCVCVCVCVGGGGGGECAC